jgi:hypothetical protein
LQQFDKPVYSSGNQTQWQILSCEEEQPQPRRVLPPKGQMGEQDCQVPMEEAFVLSVESSTSSHGEQELLLQQVSTVLICLLGSFLLVLLLWRASKQQQQSKNKLEFLLPPGLLGVPVLGETLQYIKSMSPANPTFMKEHQRRQKSLASQSPPLQD